MKMKMLILSIFVVASFVAACTSGARPECGGSSGGCPNAAAYGGGR